MNARAENRRPLNRALMNRRRDRSPRDLRFMRAPFEGAPFLSRAIHRPVKTDRYGQLTAGSRGVRRTDLWVTRRAEPGNETFRRGSDSTPAGVRAVRRRRADRADSS